MDHAFKFEQTDTLNIPRMESKQQQYPGTRHALEQIYRFGEYVKKDEIMNNMVIALESICRRANQKGFVTYDDLVAELDLLFTRPILCTLPVGVAVDANELLHDIAKPDDLTMIVSVFISELNDTDGHAMELMEKYASHLQPYSDDQLNQDLANLLMPFTMNNPKQESKEEKSAEV